MFKTKKSQLFETKPVKTTKASENPFVLGGLKKGAETTSGNGALKYSSSGNEFVNQFSSLSIWKAPRAISDIFTSQDTLWNINARMSVMFILFIRTITRVVMFWDGTRTEAPQRGSGLKHEAIGRMLWLGINQPLVFWKNIHLLVAAGSWKDIFKMMELDLVYHGWDEKKLDFKQFANLIILGLSNSNQSELIKKYLPSIDAKSKCTTVESQARTIIAKYLASQMSLSYVEYRKLKSSGTAHDWQKVISQKRIKEINFDTIHGRALMQLVTSKFLKNQGLTSVYAHWINSRPIAKFTGFVAELAGKIQPSIENHVKVTLNAQFDGLVKTAQENVNVNTGLICVVDTSGSMGSYGTEKNMTARAIAQSMSVFFAKMLKGKFANAWIEFNNTAKMHTYKANNFVDMYIEGMKSSFIGGTNFQAVIDLFISIKRTGVPESDFPIGILCLSDGEFNPAHLGKTNVESALNKMRVAGFSKEYVDNFKIILWNIPNNHYGKMRVQFETFGDVKNVFYLSGYDGSIISFITNGEISPEKAVSTAEELFDVAIHQELMQKVEL